MITNAKKVTWNSTVTFREEKQKNATKMHMCMRMGACSMSSLNGTTMGLMGQGNLLRVRKSAVAIAQILTWVYFFFACKLNVPEMHYQARYISRKLLAQCTNLDLVQDASPHYIR